MAHIYTVMATVPISPVVKRLGMTRAVALNPKLFTRSETLDLVSIATLQ
jgi:fructose-specific phosphotransferase system IIC component